MNICVVGLQWGDEGKGKIVDILAETSDIVVRYGGGANAGHTVVADGQKFALHILPSGSVRPGVDCVVANGVVVDPEVLLGEIEQLQSKGIRLQGRLHISENAHVVIDYHKIEDRLREESLGRQKIGTTARGIGPCYADKVSRTHAIRMGDFRYSDILAEKLRMIVAYKSKLFSAMYGAEPLEVETVIENYRGLSEKLARYVCDTTRYLHEALDAGKSILFEGAQGSLLDIDHGTYPYVTSSNASALGISPGCGVPARYVDRFVGLVKAYSTRVGSGPFPTEQDNEIGRCIRERGHEYGTTTGRPRRCGWFDAVAVKYSVRIGGIDEIAMMHLDTLAGMKELNMCRAYRIDGEQTDFFPSDARRLQAVECIYDTVPGWDQDLSAIRRFEDLPETARRYVQRIESIVGAPITILGVGPGRDQVIYRDR